MAVPVPDANWGVDSTSTFQWSFYVDITTGAPTVPGAPTAVTATAPGNGTVLVGWTPPASNGGATITSYIITPRIAGVAQTPFGGAGTSTTVTGLTNGTAYTFVVAAVNTVGTGPQSSASSAATPVAVVPDPPTSVTATAGAASAVVSWAAPFSNGGSVITGYTITPYIGVTGQTPTTVGNVLTTTIGSLVNGTTYTFKVAAINSVGTGAQSTASPPVIPAGAATVPGAPTAVVATAGNAAAGVAWTPPASTGGSVITGYVVTPFIAAVAQTTTTVTNVTSAAITGLANGTAYTFKVAAINAVGTGAQSSASGAVTPSAPAAAATQPQYIIEVAFGSNPQTALVSQVWTDISRYVQQFSPSSGRSHELSRIEAGRLTMRLVNLDGRFTPSNTSSPYYGPFTDGADTGVHGLEPMHRVRVRAKWNGVTYPVWHGFVESWLQVWPGEFTAYVDLSATDASLWLNLQHFGGVYYETVLADQPLYWYRLGDAAGATVSSTVPGPTTGATTGTGTVGTGVTLGANRLQPFDATTAASFTGPSGSFITIHDGAIPAGDFSVEMWVSYPVLGGGVVMSQNYGGGPSANSWAVVIDSALGVVEFELVSPGSVQTIAQTATGTVIGDGNPHHLIFTFVAATHTANIYLDGILAVSAAGTAIGAGNAPLVIGNPTANPVTDPFFQIQDVAVYTTALSVTQAFNHYTAGHAALGGQTTGARIATLLDFASWSAADRNIEPGTSTMQPITAASTILAAINDAEAAEAGICFQAPNGTITFYGRNHAVPAASQITLGEGAEPYELNGTQVGIDDLDIWNDIIITRANGVAQHAQDLASQTRYGKRTMSQTGLAFDTDGQASGMASWLLARYKTPVMRVSAIAIHPVSDPNNLYPQVLGRGLWDLVTVTRRAVGGGTAYSQIAAIERIAHTVTPDGDERTVWSLSPVDATRFWILGDSTFGVLGSTTVLAW